MATPDSSSSTSLESLAEEIKCYTLPYGALGFASHVLTYYTILCLWCGRKPLWLFSRVSYSYFDLALGGFGLLISTLLTIVTIVRCKNTWELLVIGIWKMSMSLLNGITAVHVACLFILERRKVKRRRKEGRSEEEEEESGGVVEGEVPTEKEKEGNKEKEAKGLKGGSRPERRGSGSLDKEEPSSLEEEAKIDAPIKVVLNPMRWVSWWIILYIPGMFAGVVGLMSLVVKDRKRHAGILKLTAGFYVVVGAGILVTVAGIIFRLRNAENAQTAQKLVFGGMIWVVGAFSILAVFYSDWALGMMSDNITGLPSGDASALYWTYWVSKRLPMFSL